MKVFRLRHKEYIGELIFGIPSEYVKTKSEKKINSLFEKMQPWNHAIPYYPKSKFAFVSSDAILTFLCFKTELTDEEKRTLAENFYVEIFELDTWSCGLSKFLCTYFDDEIINDTYDTITIPELLNWDYKIIYQTPVHSDDIRLAKITYYKNIKTQY